MWDKRFGGTSGENLKSFQQTSDGGYILGGSSLSSISGNKTQDTVGASDYWIVKLDSVGTIQWDKDFGGRLGEILSSIYQTKDGGYILGGSSSSGIGGDKTQPTWGALDYWIVKIDSLGNKEWDKDFGGTEIDMLYTVVQTFDGGYILGGGTLSGIGGDKTEPNRDTSGATFDYWIVKVDSLGNKQWDKTFGGTDDDGFYFAQQTTDSGYVLGGYSESDISGDKSQPTWGGAGDTDFWIIKTDSLGNKQWDKDFGGLSGDIAYSMQQTSDHGYIMKGLSSSDISGDKSQPLWGICDYWIVKIDSLGNKQWDKDYGGNDWENWGGSIFNTLDSGYLIAGSSSSPASGNKTENNLGVNQAWLVKTDHLGNLQWEKTIFTLPDDKLFPRAIQSDDGCYVVAQSSFSGIAGYKTEQNWDTTNNTRDYWIVKYCDSTSLLPIATAFTDSLLCPGTCVNFTNLSFNATSCQWNFFGASPDTSTEVNPTNICYTTPGSYDVQLIAANANGSDTLLLTDYITVFPSPPPQSISQNGDTLIAITGSASYQWYFNGNLISGATDNFYIAPASGDYNVVATDSNGCEVEAVLNNVVAGLTPVLSNGEGVVVFPNPVGETLYIFGHKLQGTEDEISIYNVLGEKIDLPFKLEVSTVDCRSLLPGIYWLEIFSPQKAYRAKFMKQ